MSTSATDGPAPAPAGAPPAPVAAEVIVRDEMLVVELSDGRTLAVPLVWYPRLWHGTPAERARYRLIGRGEGVHWPELDEDLSVEGLLAGRRSAESQRSLQRWLAGRAGRSAA